MLSDVSRGLMEILIILPGAIICYNSALGNIPYYKIPCINAQFKTFVIQIKYILSSTSHPINAASNNHSPNKCNIVLHFARPGARDDLCSEPNVVNAEIMKYY